MNPNDPTPRSALTLLIWLVLAVAVLVVLFKLIDKL